MDHFTKWIEAIALPVITAKKVTKHLVPHIICCHGAPQVILSDNTSYFVANLLKQVYHACGIHKQMSMRYHPQTNGIVERINCTIFLLFASFVFVFFADWDIYLGSAVFAYNTAVQQESTQSSPYVLVYGQKVAVLINQPLQSGDQDPSPVDPTLYVQILRHHLHDASTTVHNNIVKAQ